MTLSLINSYTRVWKNIENEEPLYLGFVNVDKFVNKEGTSFLRLRERYNQHDISFINEFKNGLSLEIHSNKDNCPPNNYSAGNKIMVFKNCVLVESQIDFLTASNSYSVGATDIFATIECDAFGVDKDGCLCPFDSRCSMAACNYCDQLYSKERFQGGCPSCGGNWK
jgi:hypothetical protein